MKDLDTAKEIVHDAFIGLWDKRAQIDLHKSYKSYLSASIYNKCINHLRDNNKFNWDILILEHLHSETEYHNNVHLVEAELAVKIQNAIDRYDEVLQEIPRVRADFGYPPLVTPSSQIVGSQAGLNVLLGESYKMVPRETKELVRGMYGKPAVPISEDILKKLIGNDVPITTRPADLIEPELEDARNRISEYIEQEEDVLSFALFPQPALEYFKNRKKNKK